MGETSAITFLHIGVHECNTISRVPCAVQLTIVKNSYPLSPPEHGRRVQCDHPQIATSHVQGFERPGLQG